MFYILHDYFSDSEHFLSGKIEKSIERGIWFQIWFEILCYFEIKSLVNALHSLHFVSHFRLLCDNIAVSFAEQFSDPRWFYFRNGLERYDHDNATTADAAISLWILSLPWHHERWNFVHGGITYRYCISLIR